MKSSHGLSGAAFQGGKIMIERAIDSAPNSALCPEEKDLTKLGLSELRNAIALPIFDKLSGTPVAVA
jgi:hypothetical protein